MIIQQERQLYFSKSAEGDIKSYLTAAILARCCFFSLFVAACVNQKKVVGNLAELIRDLLMKTYLLFVKDLLFECCTFRIQEKRYFYILFLYIFTWCLYALLHHISMHFYIIFLYIFTWVFYELLHSISMHLYILFLNIFTPYFYAFYTVFPSISTSYFSL